jgi:hypothetical protein
VKGRVAQCSANFEASPNASAGKRGADCNRKLSQPVGIGREPVAQGARQFELNATSALSAVADVRRVLRWIAVPVEQGRKSSTKKLTSYSFFEAFVETADTNGASVRLVLSAVYREHNVAVCDQSKAARLIKLVRSNVQVFMQSGRAEAHEAVEMEIDA